MERLNGVSQTDQQEQGQVLKNLEELGRWALRRHASLELKKKGSFDEYDELGPGMCRKLTTDLNSLLQEKGLVIVVDFPYAIGDDRSRIQVLTSHAYLREVGPTTLLRRIREFLVDVPISVRVTNPTHPNIKGALNLEVKGNFGQDVLYTISANEEEDPKRRFAIITYKDGVYDLILDFKTPNEPGKPIWRVNHRIFA